MDKLQKEAAAFDQHADERIRNGFIPDLRRLGKVEWFYNNVWRDPEFVAIHLMPKVEFVIDIAKRRGGKVLELGCGYGYLSLELARNGLHVTGVDLSPRSIEIAKHYAEENPFKEGFGSLRYECGNILEMDLGEETYNTVVFFGTLHHMEDLNLILAKVHRALKKQGNLIVYEPVRENFNQKSAEFAAILRAILPTWVSYEQKLKGLDNSEAWQNYVDEIYNEYTYKDEHEQSPCDNSTASDEVMTEVIGKYFSIQSKVYANAFIDKLIGGLRGDDQYVLARFLKFLDDELVRKDVLPPTTISIHAVKA